MSYDLKADVLKVASIESKTARFGGVTVETKVYLMEEDTLKDLNYRLDNFIRDVDVVNITTSAYAYDEGYITRKKYQACILYRQSR